MTHYVTGNLLASTAQALVNTVNCEGYMGKGIAYQFKLSYPKNYSAYVSACKTGQLQVGKIFSFVENEKTIFNFPTKDKWRANSKTEYIVSGLHSLSELVINLNIKSIALPPLGSGNGGLVWTDVKEIIEKQFLPNIPQEIEVYIYEPSKEYKAIPIVEPKLSLSALVLMQIKLNLEKFGSLRLQKTAFLTNLFLGDGYFHFEKGKNGPYDKSIDNISKNIKAFQDFHGEIATEQAYNLTYNRMVSESIENKMKLILPAIKSATDYANKITDNDFLECVTTILFLVMKISDLDDDSIVNLFKAWSEDKASRFSTDDIKKGILYLYETNLLTQTLTGYSISNNI